MPIPDDVRLLDAMLEDQAGQPEIYRPGPYWQGYQRRVVRAVGRGGIGNFRARPDIGKGFSDVVRRAPADLWMEQGGAREKLKTMLARIAPISGMLGDAAAIRDAYLADVVRYRSAYYEARFGDLVRAHADKLRDTMEGGCEDYVVVDRQQYSRIYVDFLARVHNFRARAPFEKARAVFEIGGGFGAWVHLVLSLFPNIRKVLYLDIPPMLYIGTQYLRHHYGAAVRDYGDLKQQPQIRFSIDNRLEIFCICPWQVERVDASIDLFWNTGSFSEMTPEIVANYAQHIERLLRPMSGVACLVMNKLTPHPRHKIALRDDVLGAFQGLDFEQFKPTLEHDWHGAYAIGRARGRSKSAAAPDVP